MKTLTTPYRHFFERIISYALMLLFVYAAISKLLDYTNFYTALYNSPIFKNHLIAHSIAILLPILELIIAILLLIPQYHTAGLLCATSLMLLFTLYIGGLLWLDIPLPCNCGGILTHLSWKSHLIFNITITVLAMLGYLFKKKSPKPNDIIAQ
ncbi:MauE/DoxX family redox-associated membrane protein [Zhouia sp. PK063]|uniref:MauE/DoxX family redox-associated membrane protein n=1 Tax=Zhouia sp. PK063 TaxID=3373602 RepID=UPI00378EAE9C